MREPTPCVSRAWYSHTQEVAFTFPTTKYVYIKLLALFSKATSLFEC
jgi:hypothetical protein